MTRWLVLGALAACSGKNGDGDGDPPLPTTGDRDSGEPITCDGVLPPIIQRLNLLNGDFFEFETKDLPTVNLEVEVSDDEGDLHQTVTNIWFDEGVDGAVDTGGEARWELPASSREEACEANWELLNNKVAVGIGELEYNTIYEFAVTVLDASGLESEVAVVSGSTPKKDGSDGDGSGS